MLFPKGQGTSDDKISRLHPKGFNPCHCTKGTVADSSLTPTTGDCPVVPEESRPQAQRLGKDIGSGWKLILSFALHFLSLSLPST